MSDNKSFLMMMLGIITIISMMELLHTCEKEKTKRLQLKKEILKLKVKSNAKK